MFLKTDWKMEISIETRVCYYEI